MKKEANKNSTYSEAANNYSTKNTNSKYLNTLIAILITAILIVSLWTCYCLLPPPPAASEEDAHIVFKPEYNIVSGESVTIWPKGTHLEQGRAAYFYAALPLVNIMPYVELTGVQQAFLEGQFNTKVIICAVNENNTVFWSYETDQKSLKTVAFSKNSPGQVDKLECYLDMLSIDIAESHEIINRISEELSFKKAVFQVLYQTDIKLAGTINHNNVEKKFRHILPLNMREESFTIPMTEDRTISEKLANSLEKDDPNQSLYYRITQNIYIIAMDALLIIALLLLLIKKGAFRKKGPKEHNRFKEWITEGSVDIKDRPIVNVHSLEGLVDLAIDTDKRVIYDPDKSNYFVLDENLIYVYDIEKSKTIFSRNNTKLGTLLIQCGYLEPDQLELGLLYQQKFKYLLGESLIILGFINENILYSTLAAQSGLTYIELDPETFVPNTGYFKNLTKNQAFITGILPLGERKDGKLAVACANPCKDELQDYLQESLKQDIVIVAACPSAIQAILEQWLPKTKPQRNSSSKKNSDMHTPVKRFSKEDVEKFTSAYNKGDIILEIFLKSAGLASQDQLAHVPDFISPLQWLISNSTIDGELAHLIFSLQKVVNRMDRKLRLEKVTPDILDLLSESDYLTTEDIKWLESESVTNSEMEQLMIENYFTSEKTIKNAKWLLSTLKTLLGTCP